jgi:hypothetical protein
MEPSMPTPLDLLLDPVSPVILALYGGLWLAEALWPARRLPEVPGAQARGLVWYALRRDVASARAATGSQNSIRTKPMAG